MNKLIPQIFSVFIVAAVLNFCVFVANATAQVKKSGELTLIGQVQVNGNPFSVNTTIFSGSAISTTPTSEATIYLHKLGKIDVHGATHLSLEFSEDSILITLEAGKIDITAFQGIKIQVKTKNNLLISDVNQASVFFVSAERYFTEVGVEYGNVTLVSEKKGKKSTKVIQQIASNSLADYLSKAETESETRKTYSFVGVFNLIINVGIAVDDTIRIGATGRSSDINIACNTFDVGPNK